MLAHHFRLASCLMGGTVRFSLQAERLETATKIYGVGLLISETFYELLSPERKRQMRTVDRVLCDKLGPNGDAVPMRIYAVAPGGDEGNRDLPKKNSYTSESEDGMDDYINGACAFDRCSIHFERATLED